MHIAIDISPLESPHSARGVGVYIKLLVDALQKYENTHKISLFTSKQSIPKNADIVHYPYFDPFFLTLPLAKPKPSVVTVHDVIPLIFPDKFSSGLRGAIKWNIQRISLCGAKRVITDSNSSKKDIVRIAGVKQENVDTVYLAPDPAYHPITDRMTQERVQKKYSLPEQYILYVGDVNWNKNVIGLLQAYTSIRKHKGFTKMQLVLVGGAFNEEVLPETQEINQFIQDKGLENIIIRPGKVYLDELACIYSLASVYLQPSHYEGFGLPVLEAMACGCPVVCTNTSSLLEIAGPSVMVAPQASELVKGILKMLIIDRKSQLKLQFDWVQRFTWKKTAQETIQSYEKVLGTL